MQNKYIDNILNSSRRRRFMKRAMALLCAITILFTINTLKHNADTMVRKAACGYPDHQHALDCYNIDGELICDRHVHTDACYQSSEGAEFALEGLEEPVAELGTIELGAIELDEQEESPSEITIELVEDGSSNDVTEEAEPEYPVGSQSVILLSEILRCLGWDVGGIVSVGQVIEGNNTPALIEVTKVGEDYEIRPLDVFDEAELGIVTEDGVVTVKLVESWVEPVNDASEGAQTRPKRLRLTRRRIKPLRKPSNRSSMRKRPLRMR